MIHLRLPAIQGPVAVYLLAVFVLFAAGCTGGGDPTVRPLSEDPDETVVEPVGSGSLQVAVRTEGLVLDPGAVGAGDLASMLVLGYLHRWLVRPDGRGGVVGDLAVRWSSCDEALTWDFTLDEGAALHDGTRISAGLIAHLWEGPDRQERPAVLANVRRVEAVDTGTLRMHLVEPDAEFPEAVATSAQLAVTTYPGDEAVGAGRYRFAGFTPEGALILRAVSREEAYRSLVFHFLSPEVDLASPRFWDDDTRELLHRVDVVAFVRPGEARPLSVELGTRIESLPSPNVRGLVVNPHNEPFDDPLVRRAVFSAVGDGACLLRGVGDLRYLTAASNWLPPDSPVRTCMARELDAAAAGELLTSAGLRRDSDGRWSLVRTADLLAPFTVQIIAPGDVYAGGETVVRLVADRLEEAGFAVDLQILPWRDFLSHFFTREYDVALAGWSCLSGAPSAFLMPWLHSRGTATINSGDFLRLDDLLDKARSELCSERRTRIYDDILHRTADQHVILPLFSTPAIFALCGEVELAPADSILPFTRDRK